MTPPLTLPILALVLVMAGAQASPDEALLDAAQQNDLPALRQALERGADVNARTRYDASALLFAARHVNLEMVRLLVERGADLAVQDTFYRNTALGSAIGGRHMELIRYLVDRASPRIWEVLPVAIELGDRPLLEAVLARADIPDEAIVANHAFAVETGNGDAAAFLQARMKVRPGLEDFIVGIPAPMREGFAGTYRHVSTGQSQTVVVGLEDGSLTARVGSRTLTLFATSELSFITPQMMGADFEFEREGNVVERLFLTRPGGKDATSTLEFNRAATEPPVSSAGGAAATNPTDTAIAPRDAARPWPSFRGSGGSGVGDGQGAVVNWDVATDRNIRWKTPIPGIANASPIVWDDRVFVATAISGAGDTTFRTGDYGSVTSVDDLSEHTWKLYSLDARSGQVVWEREVHRGDPRTKRHMKGSHASSTPATDGRHVVVLFGTAGVLAAYDMDGGLLWKNDVGLLDNGWFFDPTVQWGHSSSPIIYLNSVILQVDRQKDSFIAAYDLDDGHQLWRTSRDDEIPTWGTPTIARGRSGDELITNGTKVRGYDPETGGLRWTLGPNSEVTVGSPVVGPDLVYVTGGYPPVRPVYAIRPGFSGDISLGDASSNDAIAWSHDRHGTYIPTPILYRGLLYTLNINGVLSAYDAQTGASVYRTRIGAGGAFSASPVAADGRLYFASEDGDVFVGRAGRDYVQVAHNEMDGVIMATPAISDGLIVIRTMGHVYGIGEELDRPNP